MFLVTRLQACLSSHVWSTPTTRPMFRDTLTEKRFGSFLANLSQSAHTKIFDFNSLIVHTFTGEGFSTPHALTQKYKGKMVKHGCSFVRESFLCVNLGVSSDPTLPRFSSPVCRLSTAIWHMLCSQQGKDCCCLGENYGFAGIALSSVWGASKNSSCWFHGSSTSWALFGFTCLASCSIVCC